VKSPGSAARPEPGEPLLEPAAFFQGGGGPPLGKVSSPARWATSRRRSSLSGAQRPLRPEGRAVGGPARDFRGFVKVLVSTSRTEQGESAVQTTAFLQGVRGPISCTPGCPSGALPEKPTSSLPESSSPGGHARPPTRARVGLTAAARTDFATSLVAY